MIFNDIASALRRRSPSYRTSRYQRERLVSFVMVSHRGFCGNFQSLQVATMAPCWATDMYASGVIVLELTFGKKPVSVWMPVGWWFREMFENWLWNWILSLGSRDDSLLCTNGVEVVVRYLELVWYLAGFMWNLPSLTVFQKMFKSYTRYRYFCIFAQRYHFLLVIKFTNAESLRNLGCLILYCTWCGYYCCLIKQWKKKML